MAVQNRTGSKGPEPDGADRAAPVMLPARGQLTPWEAIALPSLRNFTLALLVAVLAAGLAAAWVLTRPSTYESRSVLEISQNAVFLDAGPGTITKLNGLRRKYAALINTRPIVVPTAEALKMEPGKVAGAVSAVVNEDSLIMYPVARAGDRRDARRIAQAVSKQLVSYAKAEQEAAKVPPDRRISLRIVDPARAAAKISPKTSRAVAMATFTALVGVASVYVLLQLATAGARTRQ